MTATAKNSAKVAKKPAKPTEAGVQPVAGVSRPSIYYGRKPPPGTRAATTSNAVSIGNFVSTTPG